MTGAAGVASQRVGLAAGDGKERFSLQAARLLLDAGIALSVHANGREAVAPLIDAGAHWCATPAALPGGCEVLLTGLTVPADAAALLAVFAGVPDGLPRPLVVDLGTFAPHDVQAVAARLAALGVDMLDVAQVEGGDGVPALRVGGSAPAFERARPLLARIGGDVRHVGALGAGRVVAGCHRMVEALTVEAVAEALTLARRLGADASRVRSALAGGFAASRILDVQGARMLARDFATGAPAGLHADALGRMVDEAHALGLDLPGTALVAQQLNALVGAGEGGLDSSALVCVLERMAGERR